MWKVRNDKVWNDREWTLSMIVAQVEALVLSWKQAYHSTTPQGNSHSPIKWFPPSAGYLKCNIDAALLEDCMGFGAVLGDHEGKFITACVGRYMSCSRDPYIAETMAVKEALTWLKSRNISHVVVESDCLNFCSTFNSLSPDLSYAGLIVKQCRSIARDIGDIVVCHVKRSANHVAHVLAQVASSFPVLTMWDSIPPSCISDLVLV
ncbi:uncharacterized protein LOC115998848 [Ipomoea triloba]|uniref:uncharacterized protein LOC115998848 n=1 Tax=Ipomoea triloba TaxID=35885 RepID=UPI00125DC472|nr:uncharacterized protein LOC115998848 [Ipomoea triloba]